MTLQETTQHILFLLNPYHLLFLLLRNSLLKSLYLFPLKLTPLHLSFFLTDPRLILIDILQLILVLHKVVIVLLIDGVLLRFDLIANHHLLIIFFLLPLFLLSLFLSHLLALSEDLHRSPLLLLHLLFPPHLILLHCPAVVLMHRPLLLHISPSFVFTPSPTLFAELQILITKILLEIVLVAALLIDLFLKIVLRPNYLLELSALGEKHLLSSLKLMQ